VAKALREYSVMGGSLPLPISLPSFAYAFHSFVVVLLSSLLSLLLLLHMFFILSCWNDHTLVLGMKLTNNNE